jgi:hypothetical protein
VAFNRFRLPIQERPMSKPDNTLFANAHGLQRGETIQAFRARMDALAQLEAAMRAGTLVGADAASRLHELMRPDIEAYRDLREFDYLYG